MGSVLAKAKPPAKHRRILGLLRVFQHPIALLVVSAAGGVSEEALRLSLPEA